MDLVSAGWFRWVQRQGSGTWRPASTRWRRSWLSPATSPTTLASIPTTILTGRRTFLGGVDREVGAVDALGRHSLAADPRRSGLKSTANLLLPEGVFSLGSTHGPSAFHHHDRVALGACGHLTGRRFNPTQVACLAGTDAADLGGGG